MKKLYTQGILLILVFLTSWFALSEVKWQEIFGIEEKASKTEQKLGEILWSHFKNESTEITDKKVVGGVDSILTKMCKANGISREKINLHILENDEVNAFALPDGHLVIYSGLIKVMEKPEQLSGVIGHELAHIQENHMMKKLVKEVGLAVLVSLAAGGGGDMIKEAGKIVSSSAFDRKLETEADKKAVDYMLKAKIDPKPYADFMYSIGGEEYLSWVSTHPESKERAEAIVAYSKVKKYKSEPVISEKLLNSIREEF